MINATVTGNLGTDPELKYSANGQPFLRFNVASNYRVREDGNWVDAVEWVRVTVLGQRAESLGQHLKKGQRVCVVGRLEARPWTDQQGGVRSGLELTAAEVDFMSPRQDDGGQQGPGRPQQAQQGPQSRQTAQAGRGAPQGGQQRSQGRMSEWDAAHGPNDQNLPF